MSVSIRNFTRQPIRIRHAFSEVAEAVLPEWDLSLVFVGEQRAKALNTKLRRKTYVPNVLSYRLGKQSGEIIICPRAAARQASHYQLQTAGYLLLLFIHGLLHIKGMAHSARMEECEQALLARFLPARQTKARISARTSISHVTTHCYRNRHRHVPDKNGRRRGGR